MAKEYAIYRGDELLIMGTAQECADELQVTKKYIQWLTSPSGKKRSEERVRPDKCIAAVKLEEEEE